MVQPTTRQSDARHPPTLISRNDVFISYSRKDKAFVETLDAAFRKANRDPWIDWDDIHKGEDWWQSIQRGIEEADTFVFVVSPDSVASTVCRDEVEYAAQCHKRFLPIVRREGFEMHQMHASISRHNWLFFREIDDFEAAFKELLKALNTDLDYVRTHTRLLVRSLEWQHKGQNSSYLLRGTDLEEAQQWLTQGIDKDPSPTASHAAYINASLDAKAATLKARQRAKWIVVLTTVLANLAIVAGGLFFLHSRMIEIALIEVEESAIDTLRGAIQGIDGDEFAALAKVDLPPEQDEPFDNPLYQQHQAWLNTVHQIAPLARPATYIRRPQTDAVVVIGDVFRMIEPDDAYAFREEIFPHSDEMLEGFEQISPEFAAYTDDDGTWIAIYGPIRNSAGDSVGVLELEYQAEYVADVQDAIQRLTTQACMVAFIWLVTSSWLILRATQPPREVSTSGDRSSNQSVAQIAAH